MPTLAASWTYQVVGTNEGGNRQNILELGSADGLPAVNDRGEVAFPAVYVRGFSIWNGAYLSRHGERAKLMRTEYDADYIAQMTIAESGKIGYSAPVSGYGGTFTPISTLTKSGVTRYPEYFSGYDWAAIAPENDMIVQLGNALYLANQTEAVAINTGFCDGDTTISSNRAGRVAFPDCTFQNLYVTHPKTAATKLRVSGTANGIGAIGQPSINAQDDIAFTASPSGSNTNAIYTASRNGTLTLVTATDNGTCSPAGPPNGQGTCTYVSYGRPLINDAGAIAITTNTANFVNTIATRSTALTLTTSQGTETVFATGMKIDGCKIAGIAAGVQGLNPSGQVAAWLTCADGSNRIALATP